MHAITTYLSNNQLKPRLVGACNTGVGKYHAQTSWGDRRGQHRFIVKQLYVTHVSLQWHGPSQWVWLRFEIKQNYFSILKKSCILDQFRTDVETYGHPPW